MSGKLGRDVLQPKDSRLPRSIASSLKFIDRGRGLVQWHSSGSASVQVSFGPPRLKERLFRMHSFSSMSSLSRKPRCLTVVLPSSFGSIGGAIKSTVNPFEYRTSSQHSTHSTPAHLSIAVTLAPFFNTFTRFENVGRRP